MRDVVVTGIGSVSSAGEGVAEHLAALSGRDPDASTPKPSRPSRSIRSSPLEFDKQIPKKSDQRQMEPWQKLGMLCRRPRARRGRRQGRRRPQEPHAPDRRGRRRRARLRGRRRRSSPGLRDAQNPGVFLNEHLMGDLRPTLFLAQLSNLLAGNISIVHGVTGASRTFMGEEASGVDALRVAHGAHRLGPERHLPRRRRLQCRAPGRAADLRDGRLSLEEAVSPRLRAGGGGRRHDARQRRAFLVLEAREHAQARGAKALASLAGSRLRPRPARGRAACQSARRHGRAATRRQARRRALRRDRRGRHHAARSAKRCPTPRAPARRSTRPGT